MPDLLKNMYNYDSLHRMAAAIQNAYSPFQIDAFLKSTMDESWNELELKARVRQISTHLGTYLPADYREAITVIDTVVTQFSGFLGIIFPDFVELYGQDEINWDISLACLERYTEYSSSEFAVRAFIIKNEERMMAHMYEWSLHKNEHVRRLASEGCRPLLPWGQVLRGLKKDPTPILPILEQLKTDSSLYVRKSVANNLNDISKTHPELVAKRAKEWYGTNEHTDWIVKHGCRTLLKKANPDVLTLFGYNNLCSIDIDDFALAARSISIGEDMTFSFSVLTHKAAKLRLEYGIDYVKFKGKRNRKIFQISEVSLKEKEKKRYTKKHSFADITVRKHYPGIHSVTLIVNGQERGTLDFDVSIKGNTVLADAY